MKQLFKIVITIALTFVLSSCLNFSKPKFQALSCFYEKTSEPDGSFYKIVGMSDSAYTIRNCSEESLRQAEKLNAADAKNIPQLTRKQIIDNCFSREIAPIEFKDFEKKSLVPILCDEL